MLSPSLGEIVGQAEQSKSGGQESHSYSHQLDGPDAVLMG